ncbi:MAG: DUF4625 domain-containing protein [Bacteroidales bacterium]|jgi:hypothetical protein|nr:DUF4625 domain-containing protein [Bacteroidales bacterium]
MKNNNWICTVPVLAATLILAACTEKIIFPDSEKIEIPKLEDASAKYLWIGRDYKLAVEIAVSDNETLTSLQLSNGEWGVDTLVLISGSRYVFRDTFPVSKDATPMRHEVELTVKNAGGGILKTTVEVNDVSAVNQIEGYNPDVLPPAITISRPTVAKFYGLSDDVPVEVSASITDDEELAELYVKLWGESVSGAYFEWDESLTPTSDAEKTVYSYTRNFTLPGGEAGEYQFMIKATDQSGNQTVSGGNLTVGVMDRLYLSDAKNAWEVTNQGYDAYADKTAWGIGTLLAMRRAGNNLFTLDYYYRNDADDNIRFIAFAGNDRPFGTASRSVTYTLDGANVLAQKSGAAGSVTAELNQADFKLPVERKGYYTITVDLNARTVTATPITDANPDFANATLFPAFDPQAPYPYLAIIAGGSVVNAPGWTEGGDTHAKLPKETEHDFLYSGEFTTAGGVNISFLAPKTIGPPAGTGWFRLPAARANMKDVYGDLISQIKPIGPSNAGANYGISLTGNTQWYATYDLMTYRLRVVKKQ